MRRILFRWFGVPIYSYPAMLYVGVVLGIYAQLYAARSIGVDLPLTLAATLLLLTIALAGARLLHVIPNWHIYRERPARIFRVSDGGAAMYGGLLVALPLSLALLAVLDMPLAAYWDTATFAIVIGMIVTRAGCFLNGCCAGRSTTSWCGINLPDYKGVWRRRIPLQILEAAWGIIVLAACVLLWRRLPFEGALFLIALGAYGAGRIVLESMRDELDRVMGMSVHKTISITFVALSLGVFAVVWLR
jgi:phosphatidylglycerol---prolipoprotein diacylglyceryl transferase